MLPQAGLGPLDDLPSIRPSISVVFDMAWRREQELERVGIDEPEVQHSPMTYVELPIVKILYFAILHPFASIQVGPFKTILMSNSVGTLGRRREWLLQGVGMP